MRKYNVMAAQEYINYYAPCGRVYPGRVLCTIGDKSAHIEYAGQEEVVSIDDIEPASMTDKLYEAK